MEKGIGLEFRVPDSKFKIMGDLGAFWDLESGILESGILESGIWDRPLAAPSEHETALRTARTDRDFPFAGHSNVERGHHALTPDNFRRAERPRDNVRRDDAPILAYR